MDVVYLHCREPDTYWYLTTTQLTETKWLAIVVQVWMNRDAGRHKGWGTDGAEATNDQQKPLPPNGVVIDKLKFYVLNFHHTLNGSNSTYMRVSPWKPLEEVQWDQPCERREAPESERHARRPNKLPPMGADHNWWKDNAVYEDGRARDCACDGCKTMLLDSIIQPTVYRM